MYAFPSQQGRRAAQLATLWPGATVEQIQDRYGRPLLYVVEANAETLGDWPPSVRPTEPLSVPFSGGPTLVGMRPDGETVTLFWRGEEPMPRNLTSFVHLVDGSGRRVGQADMLPGDGSYQTPVWSAGERIIQHYRPTLDPCLPEAPVQVLTGWYDFAAGGTRLPRADGAGDTALAGEITLPLTSRSAGQPVSVDGSPRPLHLIRQQVGEDLLLLGYDLEGQDAWQAGSPLKLNLYWQRSSGVSSPTGKEAVSEGNPPADPLLLTLQAKSPRDDAGKSGQTSRHDLWRGPVAPAGADWRPGEVFCRRVETRIPTGVPAGDYELRVDLGESAEGTAALGAIQVAPSTRRFEVPPVERPVEANLDNQVRLVGADLASSVEPGQPFTVTLVWQALPRNPAGTSQPADTSYQVFVHLVDENGQIVAQSDAVPSVGTPLASPAEFTPYPTERWVPGEVVIDVHTLQWPKEIASGAPQGAQVYRLVAGMYDPVSGRRLPARDLNGQAIPEDAIPLGEPGWKTE